MLHPRPIGDLATTVAAETEVRRRSKGGTPREIKSSPELAESTDLRSDEYRSELGNYYDPYLRR